MGKMFIGFGLAVTFGAVFLTGMATTILIYGKNPELGHYQIDEMHNVIEKANEA